jgi:hypothetical protein
MHVQELKYGGGRLAPVILATPEAEIQMIKVQSQSGQIIQETLSQILNTKNRTNRVAQVAEHLPSMYKALIQSPAPIYIFGGGAGRADVRFFFLFILLVVPELEIRVLCLLGVEISCHYLSIYSYFGWY